MFIVPPGVHLLDLGGAAHIIYEVALELPLRSICFCTCQGKRRPAVPAGCQLGKLTDYSPILLGSDDLVFVPGLESSYLTNTSFMASIGPFLEWLYAQQQRGARICSISYRRVYSGCGRLAG